MRHLLSIILFFVLPQQLIAQQIEIVGGKIIDASKTLEVVQQQIAYTLNNFLTTDHNG